MISSGSTTQNDFARQWHDKALKLGTQGSIQQLEQKVFSCTHTTSTLFQRLHNVLYDVETTLYYSLGWWLLTARQMIYTCEAESSVSSCLSMLLLILFACFDEDDRVPCFSSKNVKYDFDAGCLDILVLWMGDWSSLSIVMWSKQYSLTSIRKLWKTCSWAFVN